MPRTHLRIIRCQEQHQRRHVLGQDAPVQALARDDLRLALRRVPFLLPRRLHIARHHRIHADVAAAQIARQAARQTLDRGLGGLVDDQVFEAQMPADRPEVDDHPAARRLHRRHHRLGGEELVAQIDRLLHVGEHAGDRVEVGQVQPAEQRHMRRAFAQPLDQRLRFGLGNIDEGDLRTLPHERLDQSRADPRSTAGHDHAPIAQRGVDGPSVGHRRVGHCNSPRAARLRISAPIPNSQAGASFEWTTRLTSRPSRGVAIATVSPTLWVKP
ncbi:hypothetical protein WR25_10001 [Diploscapter pachys]|uniref:Uncharacterized protein n=1 Tax=Diploscapter pachys TaxID=2018661 RepID=A0A2A2KBQ1_9BILA|nr:hypothetical protein WR25_10001 [Diploscapter pachys]